ncbi:MAG: hypothetical protein ABEH88_04430 [Halobacteriales archaeon]
MVETHHPLVERALDVLGEELEVTTAEREAFARFRSRVSGVEPDRPSAPNGVGATMDTQIVVAGHSGESTGESLARVRTAYHETVMSVPHFESEYGEGLKTSAAKEFGPDLGSRIADGQHLTGTLQEALLAAAESAIEEREAYARNLREERDSLSEVRAGVADCEKRARALGDAVEDAARSETLADLDDQFAALEEECADLAAARQQVIHGRRAGRLSGVDGVSLTAFLYGDLETTCPGLTSIARCLEVIRSRRRECLR